MALSSRYFPSPRREILSRSKAGDEARRQAMRRRCVRSGNDGLRGKAGDAHGSDISQSQSQQCSRV
jgi:hypothetical protein